MVSSGVARILGKGVLDYARKILSHAHLLTGKVKVQIHVITEKRVLNAASELVQGFRPNLGIR